MFPCVTSSKKYDFELFKTLLSLLGVDKNMTQEEKTQLVIYLGQTKLYYPTESIFSNKVRQTRSYQNNENIIYRKGSLHRQKEIKLNIELSEELETIKDNVKNLALYPEWVQGYLSGSLCNNPEGSMTSRLICLTPNKLIPLENGKIKNITNKRIFYLEILIDGIDRYTGLLLRKYFRSGRTRKYYNIVDWSDNDGQKKIFTQNYVYVLTNFHRILRFESKFPLLTTSAKDYFSNWKKEVISKLNLNQYSMTSNLTTTSSAAEGEPKVPQAKRNKKN